MIAKLKTRWGVRNNFEFIMILLAFSLAGSSLTFVRGPIFGLFGIDGDTSLWIKVPMYIVLLMPTYQVLLLTYGTIFGQFRFFWNFEKKMLRRFGLKL